MVQDPACGSQLQTKRWKVGLGKAIECRGPQDLELMSLLQRGRDYSNLRVQLRDSTINSRRRVHNLVMN